MSNRNLDHEHFLTLTVTMAILTLNVTQTDRMSSWNDVSSKLKKVVADQLPEAGTALGFESRGIVPVSRRNGCACHPADVTRDTEFVLEASA